jgi:tRNA (cmo5U34)-methyltransferase
MNLDKVFDHKFTVVTPFEFNQTVADCFDDMVSRSVPFYEEVHHIILSLLEKQLNHEATIYDLGCSTGTTMSLISKHLPHHNLRFYGVDESVPMLEKCRQKLNRNDIPNVELIESRIEDVMLTECDVVIMNYTLQFLPLKNRQLVLDKIYRALRPGGMLILTEKLRSKDPYIEEIQTELYYDFKRRNGYSELEISQKREALENVLIPLSLDEQLGMLDDVGFAHRDIIFKWFNFASYLAIKK